MRYHYEKPTIYLSLYGDTHICDHPVYNSCTLYKIGDKGLAVIQQRFDKEDKAVFWTNIDPWLTDDIYLHPRFRNYFDLRARPPINDLYPTVALRQIMWALRMKPTKRERWETYFDRKEV